MTRAEVTDDASLVIVTFTCDCWLDDAVDRSLEYTLTPPPGNVQFLKRTPARFIKLLFVIG